MFFLVGYAFFLVAMFLYVRDEERRARWRGILDAVIVSAGTALLVWASLPEPAQDQGGLVQGLVAAAYPTADVLLLVVVASLLFSPTRPFTASDGLLVSSIALLLATDVAHAELTVHGAYVSGSTADAGWLAAYLVAGAAALHPSVARRRLGPPWRRLAGLRVALVGAGMVAPAITLVRTSADETGMRAAAAALAVLALVRAIDLLHRNERLRHQAEASEERFRNLVGDVDAIVWEADPATRAFSFVSRHAESLLGYPAAAWTEDPDFWLGHLHPDDRRLGPGLLRRIARAGARARARVPPARGRRARRMGARERAPRRRQRRRRASARSHGRRDGPP